MKMCFGSVIFVHSKQFFLQFNNSVFLYKCQNYKKLFNGKIQELVLFIRKIFMIFFQYSQPNEFKKNSFEMRVLKKKKTYLFIFQFESMKMSRKMQP